MVLNSIKYLTSILLLTGLGLTFCGDDEDSLNAGECSIPTVDGAFHEVPAGCRALDEEEHIRLKGVDIPLGESITIIAFAGSASDSEAYEIVIDGSGTVTWSQGSTEIVSATGIDVTGKTTICFDLHSDEDPDHLLFWTGSNCSGEASEEAAEFNSEDDGPLPSWTDPGDVDFFYQVSSGASLGLIETDEPFFEEAE